MVSCIDVGNGNVASVGQNPDMAVRPPASRSEAVFHGPGGALARTPNLTTPEVVPSRSDATVSSSGGPKSDSKVTRGRRSVMSNWAPGQGRTPESSKRRKSLIQTIFDRIRHSPMSIYSTMSDQSFCRICHESDASNGGGDDDVEPLISPCNCSGSVGLIHRSCLEKWLSTANDDKCEICGHKFEVTAKARPFKQWLCGVQFGHSQKNLTADVVCFLVLTPLASILTYLCAAGADHYFHLADHTMEAFGLMFLACFLCVIYFVWIGLSIRFHLNSFREWQKNNQDIRLVEIVHRY